MIQMKNKPNKVLPQSSKVARPAPILPNWVFDGSSALTLENASFASGSALALLHSTLNNPDINIPGKLLRQQFALKAAVTCLKFEHRSDDENQLLDAYYLTASGDARGPGGDMLAFWFDACAISFRGQGWQNRVLNILPEPARVFADAWLDMSWDDSDVSNPVAAAVKRLIHVTQIRPREEALAFLMADITLSKRLGLTHPFPFFAHHLKMKQLQGDKAELLKTCHMMIAVISEKIIRVAHDLARRTEKIHAIAPKLRAKGSDQAVELFLSELAVSPSGMLYPKIKGSNVSMTQRSANRLCDRLVDLGVVRELTGRPTFRLYGI